MSVNFGSSDSRSAHHSYTPNLADITQKKNSVIVVQRREGTGLPPPGTIIHSRDSSSQQNRFANLANSQIIRMPPNLPNQPRTHIAPGPVPTTTNPNFHSQAVTFTSTSHPGVRTTQSQAALVPATSHQSSSSVQHINQRLENISSGIKDGRPIIVSYSGQNANQRNVAEQRNVIQGGSSGQVVHNYLPFPYPSGTNTQTQQVVHQNQHLQLSYQPQQGTTHSQSHSQPHFSSQQQNQPQFQLFQNSQQTNLQPQPQVVINPRENMNINANTNDNAKVDEMKEQITLWESRYFAVVQKFKYFHDNFDSISKEYSQILEKMEKCDDQTQFQAAQQQLVELQQKMQQLEQNLVEVVHKNKELGGQTVNWKAKYQQILAKTEKEESPQLTHKLQLLQSQLIQIQQNHEKVIKGYQQSSILQAEAYQKQINELNTSLQQNMQTSSAQDVNQLSQLQQIIREKDEEINTLRLLVEKQQSAISNEDYSQNQNKSMLNALKKEREEIIKEYERVAGEYQNYRMEAQSRIDQYKTDIRQKDDELQRYAFLVKEKDQNMQIMSQNQGKAAGNQLITKLETLQAEAQGYRQHIFNLEQKIKQDNKEQEAYQKKFQQYETQLSSRNKQLQELTLKIQNQSQQQSANQSVVSITAENENNEEQIDLAQLNENMIMMEKLYAEKCQELEIIKKQNGEYEGMLTNARQEFVALQGKYSELAKSKPKDSARSSDSEGELVILRKKVEQAEKKAKKLSSVEFQNDELKRQNQKLERDIMKARASQTHQINDHIQLLEENIGKKDQEISRLRQTNQLLQTNIDEMNLELDKIRLKASSDFKIGEGEKGQLKNHIVSLQFKLSQYERKVNSLEDVKTLLQQQISSTTAQLHAKIEHSQKIEGELRQQRLKIKSFEDDLQLHFNQTEENKLKLKDNERKTHSLIKSLQNQLDRKKEESIAKTSQVAVLNSKIQDLQKLIKSKDTQIGELQKNSDTLKNKINGFDAYFDQIKYLKQKISQYEHKVSSLSFRPTTRSPNTEPTQIFQRKVIYQLKLENEALKQRLGINVKVNGSARDKEGQTDVKERLTDFNHKLEELISGEGVQLNGDGELYKKYERDRRRLIERHNEEITQLKVKILQLQSQPGSYSINEAHKFPSAQNVYNQQIVFYKQKNQQLEQMVDNHIKVNKDLRDSIERLMRGQNDEYSLAYYKDQMIKSNQLNVTLQEKIKRLQVELRKLRDQMGKVNSRPADGHAELEIRIVELNRRISQLVIEINQLEQDKVTYTQTISSLQKTILKLKSEIDVYILYKQDSIRKQRQNQNNFEEQISKLNSKIRIQTSEIDQLNQLLNKRQMAESLELQNIKLKITEYQEEIKKLRMVIEEYRGNEEHYQREMMKLQNQIQMLHLQIQRLRENQDITVRKYKEYDLQINNFRSTIADFQGRIRNKDAAIEEYNLKETQIQQQLSRFKSQNGLLNQEIERINQFSQKKINEKDIEIQRLKALIGQLEKQGLILKDQLNQSKYYMTQANQSSQQITLLEEQIAKYKSALGSKNMEFDQKSQEVYELLRRISLFEEQISSLRGSSDKKISQLEQYISRLEYEQKDSQKSRQNLDVEKSGIISGLQAQIRQLQRSKDMELNQLRITIQRLQTQIRQLQKDKQNGGALEAQLIELKRSYEIQINQLRVTIQRYEVTIRQLEQDCINFQNQIRQLQSSKEMELNDLRMHIQRLQATIRDLERGRQDGGELQRIISSLQLQLRQLQQSKDEEISRLRHSLTIKEEQCRELVMNLNIWKTKGSELENQLNLLRIQKEKEKNNYLEIIRRLELEITELKNQIANSDGNSSHLSGLVKKLEAELIIIREKLTIKEREYIEITHKLAIITQKISVYELEITRYKQTIIEIETNWAKLDQAYKVLLGHSSFTIEFLRSILISIQTLLEEDENTNSVVISAANKQIEQGLDQCSHWHGSLF